MRPITLIAAASLAVSLLASAAHADVSPLATKPSVTATDVDRPALTIGDRAPALAVGEWLKGDPVSAFERGKVYVVEFWATWCGPCKRAMPHLAQVQKAYADKGVTIISITSEDDRGNTLDAVKQMVAEKNDIMAYTVAWDQGRSTNDAYMAASEQPGIPSLFIVDGNGIIAHIGFPGDLEQRLDRILAGKNDLKADNEAHLAGSRDERMFSRYRRLARSGDVASAMTVARSLAASTDDAGLLNAIAWSIVNPQKPMKDADLGVALTAAQRAADLTKHKDASILDTLSRVHWTKGDKDNAIKVQTEAVGLAKKVEGPEGAEMLQELEKSLAEYTRK
jgi:thiol-disulfide isomerase/thioredoxin